MGWLNPTESQALVNVTDETYAEVWEAPLCRGVERQRDTLT